jgi:hypothetical protein
MAYCVEAGGVVVGEGVEVLLGGAQAAVAKAFFDDLDVGAAGEEPGCVGAAQVVHSDAEVEVGGGDGGVPDALANQRRGMCRSVSTARLTLPLRGSSMPDARRVAR